MSAIKKYLEHDYLNLTNEERYYYLEDSYFLDPPQNINVVTGINGVFTFSCDDDPIATLCSVSFSNNSGGAGGNASFADDGQEHTVNTGIAPGTYTLSFRYRLQVEQDSGTRYFFSLFSDNQPTVTVYSGTITDPVIDDGGVYAAEKSISITTSSSGATIKYTTDGSDPSESNGEVYSGPFTVTDDVTIKAIAYKTGWITSQIVSESVKIIDNVTHTSTGTFSGSKINLSWNVVEADSYRIYYSTTAGVWSGSTFVNVLDGAASSYEFTATPATTTYFRVAAVRDGTVGNLSTQTSAIGYEGTMDNVAFSVAEGTYEDAFNVTLSSEVLSPYIRFTLDGSTPTTTTGTMFDPGDVITVDDTVVIKALAYKPGWYPGTVQTVTYKLLGIPLLSGSQVEGQSEVGLSWTAETGADAYMIYWSTSAGVTNADDFIIVSEGTTYTHAVDAGYTYYYKVATLNEGEESVLSNEISVGVYMGAVATPAFGLLSGAYAGQRSLTITSATSGVSIRYTTDGSDPSPTSGNVYAGALVLDESVNIKAIAYKTGWENSSIIEGSFTITNPVGAVASAVIPPSGNTAVTVEKEGLQTITKVANDPVFSNPSNWRWVMLVYIKSTGGKRYEGFDARQGTPQGIIKAKDPAGTVLTLQRVFVVTEDRQFIKINRNELLNASQLDLEISSS